MSHIDQALLEFASRVIGTKVRGQIVEGVNIDMDTISQPKHPLRFILAVCFKENPPPSDATPEQCLVSRVFSEIPWSASIVTNDRNELMAILSGERVPTDAEWILSDELMGG